MVETAFFRNLQKTSSVSSRTQGQRVVSKRAFTGKLSLRREKEDGKHFERH
jgi:hypothetical protein